MTTPKKPRLKPAPLTNAERSKRFVEMAKKAKGTNNPKAFDRAFDRIAKPRKGAK
jgi:hypothetical protein